MRAKQHARRIRTGQKVRKHGIAANRFATPIPVTLQAYDDHDTRAYDDDRHTAA